MTNLWQCFWDDDIDSFCRLLAPAGASQTKAKNLGSGIGSGAPSGTSPRSATKSRKLPGFGASVPGAKGSSSSPGRAEINSRDYCGLTLLLRAASSTSTNAIAFVEALLGHPAIDIYVQDPESGWNALHRSLYSGNISIARLLLEKERRDLTESYGSSIVRVGQLIKTKDHEGNSPFDLYNATIGLRSLNVAEELHRQDDESDTEEITGDVETEHPVGFSGLGEEVFMFGSNKNFSLGVGHEDDRQYPERVYLERPEHLIQFHHDQWLAQQENNPAGDGPSTRTFSDVPALIQNRPLIIQDAVLSKFHSAILTTDQFSNLYVSGLGRGGRLGLGDENTKLTFTPVQGGLIDKRVTAVALGQNHTLAVTNEGELWSWGSNSYSQLGYMLPLPIKPDEEPISTTPRQVFGPLKKEKILGVAASSIHSVVHTSSSLFCWGKNVGQLGLMDADSRSLEVQTVPRKVAATLISSHSSLVLSISAIDRATCCLFGDHSLVIFTSYGYKTINLQNPALFSSSTLHQSMKFSSTKYDSKRRKIYQIASGGDTIAAVTGSGDLFTMQLSHNRDDELLTASTTNPSKMREAVTTPQCIWNSHKDGVKSVGVGDNGSVIISTHSGAVWRRIRRTKFQDTKGLGSSEHKRKDFKFQRVPYITNVAAVRSSVFGAFAAVRKDCDVTRDQLDVSQPTLWEDVGALLPLRDFKAMNSRIRENKDACEFQDPEKIKGQVDDLTYEILTSTDLEDDLSVHLSNWASQNGALNVAIRSASNAKLCLPVHSWILSARSPVLRAGLQQFRATGSYEIPEVLTITREEDVTLIEFVWNIDILALLNIIVYMYTDRIIPAWNFTRQVPPLAYRYRQTRADVMKLATRLGMPKLEAAARLQTPASRSMNVDFQNAITDTAFFEDGDTLLQLDGDEIPVHSVMLCQRCSWFQGLFNGRSRGQWLESRRATLDESDLLGIDLSHMDPGAFSYVLQYLYTDVGDTLFDSVLSDNIDEFVELVIDVMSIADELMIDRLSQICQTVIGRFVSIRNISTLLNIMSPYFVVEFKKKGLEYICLQMEAMLENHLMDDLDQSLLHELDQVVRDNQLARSPFSRSGRAEQLFHEQNPWLAQDMSEERQIRAKDIYFRANRVGNFDDLSGTSSANDKTARQRSKPTYNDDPFNADHRPKTSLVSNKDEDIEPNTSSIPPQGPILTVVASCDESSSASSSSTVRRGPWVKMDNLGNAASSPSLLSRSIPLSPPQPETVQGRESQAASPWQPASLPIDRLDLRETLAESSSSPQPSSSGPTAQGRETGSKPIPQKLSQKERKKQLQQLAEESARQELAAKEKPQSPWTQVGDKKNSPWQKSGMAPTTPKKDLLHPDSALTPRLTKSKQPVIAEASTSQSTPRRTASPDTRFAGQKPTNAPNLSPASTRVESQPLTPHSKTYITRAPKPEQEVGLALADIITQQQREQQSRREAVAKRSLQEIQQEQAFQEWWDQESRRMQEEEARRNTREGSKDSKDKKKEVGRRRRGGNKTKSSETGNEAGTGAPPESSSSKSKGKGRANKEVKTRG